MKRIFLPSLFTILLATASYAKDGSVVMGAGNDSCGKWLESRETPSSHYQYKQWIFGFVSGTNWTNSKKQATPPDGEATVLFIDQYCKNNPLHTLVLAAAALVQESGGQKVLHQWSR